MGRRKRLHTVEVHPQTDEIPDTQSQNGADKDDFLDEVSDHDHLEDFEGSTKKYRGPTLMAHIWNQPPEKRIVVKWNKLWQPIGDEGCDLTSFLGTIARNPELCSLAYTDWRRVPKEEKIGLLKIVKSKFKIQHPQAEKYVLKSIGKKWSSFKYDLKYAHFETNHGVLSKALSEKPDYIPKDQWVSLVTYWSSEKCKQRTVKNRESRKDQEMPHTAGSKSFARVTAEKTINGVEPTRAHVYLETHKDRKELINAKLGQLPHGKETSDGSVAWEGDIYSQVMKEVGMGPERKGRVRGLGMGPTSLLYTSSNPRGVSVEEDHELCNRKIEVLESHIKMMEQEQAKMKGNIAMLLGAFGRRLLGEETPSTSTGISSRSVANAPKEKFSKRPPKSTSRMKSHI